MSIPNRPALRVAILGGGPAGLTAARLVKLQQPHWSVTVFERNSPTESFGYGVGLSLGARKLLRGVDPSSADQLDQVSHPVGDVALSRDGVSQTVYGGGNGGIGISRAAMLRVMAEQCRAVGVDVRMDSPMSLDQVADADIVVAADGVGSPTRAALHDVLGVSATAGDLAYLWCGADVAHPTMVWALARTTAGPLAAHVMPFGPASSTFQVDAHVSTVAALGLDEGDVQSATFALLREKYRELLGDAALHLKQQHWSTFTTVTCERWYSGNVVLVGDAAHTAHYTVGSGTGLAIEDAITLAESLAGEASINAAFSSYEQARKPRLTHLQLRASRSERWWTSLALRMDAPLPQVLLSQLTRTGAITLAKAEALSSELVRACLDEDCGDDDLVAAALGQPLTAADVQLASRQVVTDQLPATSAVTVPVEQLAPGTADAVIERVRETGTPSYVRLTGGSDREAVLDRLEIAEQVCGNTKALPVVVASRQAADDLALGVLTGRTPLIEFSD